MKWLRLDILDSFEPLVENGVQFQLDKGGEDLTEVSHHFESPSAHCIIISEQQKYFLLEIDVPQLQSEGFTHLLLSTDTHQLLEEVNLL